MSGWRILQTDKTYAKAKQSQNLIFLKYYILWVLVNTTSRVGNLTLLAGQKQTLQGMAGRSLLL